MKVAVIGLGTAGITFISEIRRLKFPCEIFLFEKRGPFVFHPCSIPEAIEGKIDPSQLIDNFNMSRINFLGTAKEVDPYNLCVSYEKDGVSGKTNFDFIFIATGGEIIPPSPNYLKATKYEDVVEIKSRINGAKSVAVVGAGILGLELASALSKFELKIDVFEAKEQILPGFLDRKMADKLLEKIEKENISFHFGKYVEKIEGFDLIIFCTGFKPVSPLPFPIKVDEYMRVINPENGIPFDRVFAAGDCISYDFPIPRVAPIAAEQARVCARNIKRISEGKEPEEKYELIIPPVLIKAFGYEIGKVAKISKSENSQKFHIDLKVLPFEDKKITIFAEVDKDGFVQELQAFSELRSEVRHILDIFYISIKKKIPLSEIRRFELSYQPEVCKFPDPITSFAEVISRRLGIF